MSFSIDKHPNLPGIKLSGGGFYVLKWGHSPICDLEHWGFSSCGVDILFNFKGHHYQRDAYGKPLKDENGTWLTNLWVIENHAEDLLKFFASSATARHPTMSYNPKEYYMLLSDTQIRQLPTFLKNPKVRRIDSFENKSHGPNDVHLYRISCNGDFKT